MSLYGRRTLARGSMAAMLVVALGAGYAPSAYADDLFEGVETTEGVGVLESAALSMAGKSTEIKALATEPQVQAAATLETGKTYTVPVTFLRSDGSGQESMAGNMVEPNATVTVGQGGMYIVTLVVKAGDGYEFKGLTLNGAAMTLARDASSSYVFTGTLSSLENVIAGFTYYVAAMNQEMSPSAIASFNVVSATPVGGNTGESKPSTGSNAGNQDNSGSAGNGSSANGSDGAGDGTGNGSQGGNGANGSDNATNNGAGNNGNNGNGANGNNGADGNNAGGAAQPGDTAATSFEVGHTYRVPMTFAKTGTTETSMAAQYFGEYALVRPQSDGTFKVSFSTNRTDYISGLSYQGAEVPQDGAEYTLDIPAATGDVVLPMAMSIKPMVDLGGGDVQADLRLSLGKAEDLGTGKANERSTSDNSSASKGTANRETVADAAARTSKTAGGTQLAQTGDEAPLTAAPVALLAAASAAALMISGRKMERDRSFDGGVRHE